MTGSYYLWKWADNDLAGRPNDVFSELLHGRLHPALQSFDAQPVVRALHQWAATRQDQAADWLIQVQPASAPGQAHFIYLQCPAIPVRGQCHTQFIQVIYQHGLSGYDETSGTLIKNLLPKRNTFVLGQAKREWHDLEPDDLAPLLHRLDPQAPDPFAILTNHSNHFVQCYAEPTGYLVEWRENRSLIDPTDYDHWRASYPPAPAPTRATTATKRRREQLRFADTLGLFREFLQDNPRPRRFRWRSLRPELEQAPVTPTQGDPDE